MGDYRRTSSLVERAGTPESATQFISDFFNTDIMNHCEFLKYIVTQLGTHDETLLIALLERLASGRAAIPITPFYYNHQDLPKNPVNVAKAYVSLKQLREHSFNIYEASFLNIERLSLFFVGLLTIVLQWVIFGVLLLHNLPSYRQVALVGTEPSIWVLAISTTCFFARSCWEQCTSAIEFYKTFASIGHGVLQEPLFFCSTELGFILNSKKVMILCSMLGKQALAILVPFLNLLVLVMREDPNEAVLDSVALFFVLKLDEIGAPRRDMTRFLEDIASYAQDFIMVPMPDTSDYLTVTKVQGDSLPDSTASPWGERRNSIPETAALPIIGFPKTYVLYPKKGLGGWEIAFFQRADSGNRYLRSSFRIVGKGADELVAVLQRFECYVGGGCYGNIHD